MEDDCDDVLVFDGVVCVVWLYEGDDDGGMMMVGMGM